MSEDGENQGNILHILIIHYRSLEVFCSLHVGGQPSSTGMKQSLLQMEQSKLGNLPRTPEILADPRGPRKRKTFGMLVGAVGGIFGCSYEQLHESTTLLYLGFFVGLQIYGTHQV